MTINLDQYTNTLNVTDTATNADINVTTKGTGVIKFSNGGGEAFRTLDAGTTSGSAYWTIQGSSGGFPFISVDGTNPNINAVIAAKGSSAVRFYTGGTSGVEQLRVTHTSSAVNVIQATGAATGANPIISAQGSDTNVSLSYIAKGTGVHAFSSPSAVSFQVNSQTTNVNYGVFTSTSAGTSPLLQVVGTDTNVDFRFRTQGTGGYQFDTGSNSNSQLRLIHTASAVNYVQVTGNATGGGPSLSAQGSDSNVSLVYIGKGIGGHVFTSGNGANIQIVINNTTSAVNYHQFTGSATGNAIVHSAAGSDTNIDLAFTPKGTGNVRFGTYTANMALTIQGYVEIKDSGGTVRRLAVIA